ncbi:hypothetical protein [Flavilitoribacter nigricans]|uniref:hypothetical protein n=1 Tax=Flavilitoribacter nigricans TaxID=70997 RepID=UPI00117AF1CA|nr:hypothetical protein [Flavilitoribacter nigricans]
MEISDDSGFMGIANFSRYRSFLSRNWDFEMIKKRIVEEINSHHLLFWSTGLENTWKVKIAFENSDSTAFRENRGVIEVTDGELFLTNYEALTMAAQYQQVKLPESHHKDLAIKLENGKYMVKFRQLFNPDEYDFATEDINFEIVLMRIEKNPEIYVNNVNEIYWSAY